MRSQHVGAKGSIVTGGEQVPVRDETPALAQLGRLLRETPKNVGRAGMGRPNLGGADVEPPKDETPTLADLGLDAWVAQRTELVRRRTDADA